MSLPRGAALDRFSCAEGLTAERAEAAALLAAAAAEGGEDGGWAAPGCPQCADLAAAARGEGASASGGSGACQGTRIQGCTLPTCCDARSALVCMRPSLHCQISGLVRVLKAVQAEPCALPGVEAESTMSP